MAKRTRISIFTQFCSKLITIYIMLYIKLNIKNYNYYFKNYQKWSNHHITLENLNLHSVEYLLRT
jgi:hypothetical protein